jgi:hypothetical protein
MPEAKTSWEKLEMMGKPTTISELQTAVTNKSNEIGSRVERTTRNIFSRILSAIGKLISFTVQVFIRFGGLITLLCLIIAMVTIIAGLVLIYFNPVLPPADLSFINLIPSPVREIGFVALGLIFLTPIAFAIDVSENLFSWKWKINTSKILTMIGVWTIGLITFWGIAKFNYPKYKTSLKDSIEQLKNATWINDEYSVVFSKEKVKNIDIADVKEVIITEGDENEVKIVGSKLEQEELNKKIENGTLTIKGKSQSWFGCKNCTSSVVTSVRIEIKTNKVENIKLDGNINAWYYPMGGNATLEVANATGLKVAGKLDKADVKASNHSVINLIETNISEAKVYLQNATAKVWSKKIYMTAN